MMTEQKVAQQQQRELQEQLEYQEDYDIPVRQLVTDAGIGNSPGDTFISFPASSAPTSSAVIPEGAIDEAGVPKFGAASSLNYTETVSAGKPEDERSRPAPSDPAEISSMYDRREVEQNEVDRLALEEKLERTRQTREDKPK